MSKVTRSSRKLNAEESGSRRRSSSGGKEARATVKGSRASVSASGSPSSRRSARGIPSRKADVSSPSSSKKSKRGDTKLQVTSAVGVKRKSRDEKPDSPLPPSKRRSGPNEKKTPQKSSEIRSGDKREKNAKKTKTHLCSNTKQSKKNKTKKKPEKIQKSKSPGSLDIRKSEERKTSRGSSSGDFIKGQKQEGVIVRESPRASKKWKGNVRGETPKASDDKIPTTSKRLDARRYRELFTPKPKKQTNKESDHLDKHGKQDINLLQNAGIGQCSDAPKDGCSETVTSNGVMSNTNIGHEENMDLADGHVKGIEESGHGDGHVKGIEESGHVCRLCSDKTAAKCIQVREDKLREDVETTKLEVGTNRAEDVPQTAESEETDMLAKHQKNSATNFKEAHSAEDVPQTAESEETDMLAKHQRNGATNFKEAHGFTKSLSPSVDKDSRRKTSVSEHQVPQIGCEIAVPCESGKIPSIDVMGSSEGNSLEDHALCEVFSNAGSAKSNFLETKDSAAGFHVIAADLENLQLNENTSDSYTSRGGLEVTRSSQNDSHKEYVFSSNTSPKNNFSGAKHSGQRCDIVAADLGSSQLNQNADDSCTSKGGHIIVDRDHDTSVDTRKEFCTLKVSKDETLPVLLSGSKRDRCEERLESYGNDNNLHGTESSKKSRVNGTSIRTEDRKSLQRIHEHDSEACTNYSLIKSLELEHPKQTECNTCGICKLGGKLLCCDGKGCRRAYHLSCLDPPLKDVPPGTWHCLWCVKRKLEFGLHSVSQGVESIWDVRVNEVSTGEGSISVENKLEKEYLVKYKGLAHVHNCWVPESQVLVDVPKFLAYFNGRYQKNKAPKWKSEWTEPQRLLKRRLLMPPKVADEYFRINTKLVYCNGEWLVKWKGLGYECATWEMENASFFTSPEALNLVKDYETRREKAKKASDHSTANMVHPEVHFKLQKFSYGHPCQQDLQFINKLYEYWHGRRNAVVMDDQERIARVISFISSLLSNASRPFLIISTSSAIPVWELEIMHVSPSIDLVVYNGSKDARDMIRGLEFYEESGCIMFQVLLSTPDAVAEDMEFLECIGWESVIVDECHNSRVSKHFEKIKMLSTDFRLLLFTGQIKDSILEYLNILSLLDAKDEGNCISFTKDDGNSEKLAVLKQKFSNHIAYEHKSGSSKFVEYWIPVLLSNAQLEQYCSILVSNSSSLCLKNDPFEALPNILLSLKKSCDHPYLVDETLQSLLTKGLPESEFLDVGVRASGKLLLLDKVLAEVKKRGLRVLILFQLIGGCGPHSIGDILDDYLRQRFGADSYERIDSGLTVSKKQSALSMFNNKEMGSFVFLLEIRACAPSIKLSSVDVVILFDSDWNPSNDLRALQRINIDSQIECLTVFRLYSPYTMEEKVLSLSTQNMALDNKLGNISPGIRHMLLMWCSAYLFKKFDDLQDPKVAQSDSILSHNQNILEETVKKLVSLLPPVTHMTYQLNNSAISKVKQNGSFYSKSTLLVGESQSSVGNEDQPHIYWRKLLDGRFDLRFSTGLVQRPRRKVQHLVQSSMKPVAEIEDDIKKQKKAADRSRPVSPMPGLQGKEKVAIVRGGSNIASTNLDKHVSDGSALASCTNPCSIIEPGGQLATQLERESASGVPFNDHVLEASCVNVVESEDGRQARVAQQSLHDLLKPELLNLCKALQLPKEVMDAAVISLEYVMKNHQVPRESETILQAFQMSLCWTAASMLKHDLDHGASLLLAKQQLKFDCKKAEVKSVYKKLRFLRPYLKTEISGGEVDRSSKGGEVNIHENCVTHAKLQEPAGETRDNLQNKQCSENVVSLHQGQAPTSEQVDEDVNHSNACHEDGADQEKISETAISIDKLNSVKKKRARYILEKQKGEFSDFLKFKEMEITKMTKEYETNRSNILKEYSLFIRTEKLNILLQDFADRRACFTERMKVYQNFLTDSQQELRNRESQTYLHWLEEAKAGRSVEPYLSRPLPIIQFQKELLQAQAQNLADGTPENMSQDDSLNKGITFVPLTNGLESTQTMPSELEMANGKTTYALETLSDNCSMRAADSGVNLEGQGTSVASARVENRQDLGSINASAPMKQGKESDAALRSMESNVLGEPNHATAFESDPNILTVNLGTGARPSTEYQIEIVDSQIADRMSTELSHVQASSVDPDQMSASAETAREHDDGVAELDSLSQARIAVHQPLDAFPLSAEQIVQASSTFPDEGPAHAEPGGRDHGCTVTGIGSHSQARVSLQPLDASPSSAGLVVQVSSVDPEGRSASAETGREHNREVAGLESLCQARVSVQQPLDALSSSVGQVQASSANPDERFASAGTARENEHAVAMLGSLLQARVSVQLPNDALISSAEQVVQCPFMSESTTQSQVLLPLDIESTTSTNFRLRTIGTEPGLQISQIAATPTFRSPLMNYPDPLYHEILRMRKEEEQTCKLHEDEKLRLVAQRDKEMEEVKKKYAILLQDADARYLLTKKTLEDNMNKVMLNRHLAETLNHHLVDRRVLQPTVPQGISSTQALIQQSGSASQGSVANRPDGMSVDHSGNDLAPLALSAGDQQLFRLGLNTRRPAIAVPSQPSLTTPVAVPRTSQQVEVPPRCPVAFTAPWQPTGLLLDVSSLQNATLGAAQASGNIQNRMSDLPPLLEFDAFSNRLIGEHLPSSDGFSAPMRNTALVYLSDDD